MQAGLIVLDGWGLGSDDGGRNAIEAADTPNFDRIANVGAYGTLDVSGRRVGLPEGQMGNSEVGHLNIGAGRVVRQEYTRISDAIEADELGQNDAITDAFEYANDHDGRVHFMGLVSEGGVHSAQRHLYALIELAANRGVEAVTHAFTDGRDTSPKSGEGFLGDLQKVVGEHETGEIATVSGRYYAMDRDQNWERTKRAYDAIVNRDAEYTAETAVDAVRESYERGETDEFVEPTVISGTPALEDGDAVVFFNFRSDRARQLTRMICDIDPVWEFETHPPEIEFVMMTQYDAEFDLPVAFPPDQPEDTLGEVLAENGKTQLRLAESEKYAHVTYFLNGGREVEFDGEIRKIVESPDVPTYDQKPEMSAKEVTDTAISVIESDDPDVLVLNYANPDMVGHTGDFDAAVTAVEAVDEQLGRLVESLQAHGAHVFITADHGNADDMGTPDDPHTAHTYNAVPLVYLSPEGDNSSKIRSGGSLCDLAPTLLSVIGVPQPDAMTGESLLYR
ncbi:2,3-bisphosphoglycerate-independent phosphoglycerate mutase [Haladaptatus caseinilyticus]|uniref:2,3-bisphosphoglycerate-independent phosphoglycerate mutase n=1 Tax=Haladaptatus caseinilyticus TaxID=2993314 RepID=UPI00224A930E|nr:2,3-bisphosphoglycerate-independent phosphoglycerate mutase [Haladaptatus caseinilyticus]